MKFDFLHIILIIVALAAIIRLCYIKNTAITGWEELETGKKHINNFVTAWTQHMLYQRLLLMANFSNNSEEQYIKDRLYLNQVHLSELMSNKYGEKAGHNVLFHLVGYMRNLINLLEAVKSGDQKIFNNNLEMMYNNAKQLGNYFDELTNKNVFTKLIQNHTQALINNIMAYHSKNYQRDIDTLDNFFNTGITLAVEMAHARDQ